MAETLVMPLGGLGEMGLNCLAVQAGGALAAIDCGLLFPGCGVPGVECAVPDLSYLRQQREQFRAVFLTHGHEDHVGAVPGLLEEFPVPVYGTPMTLGLLERRVRETRPRLRENFRAVAPGAVVTEGPFRAEFIRVTHSTPDACAVALTTPGGSILHTGDFKFDPCPIDGKPTDETALARWGERGVDLLCCDSTGALRDGATPAEAAVRPDLRRLMAATEGRVYLSTFSSHVHRVQQVVEISRELGRRVVFLGKSLSHSVRLARRLGHLKSAPGDIVPEHRGRGLPREALTVVLGGCQAEAGSALWRVAHGREPHHRVLPGDLLVLSSRLIPGNETAVHALINRCLRQGARVHYGANEAVHVSGHPAAADVARMFELTRPRNVLPVHGELRMLEALAGRARAAGICGNRIFRRESGSSLVLEDGRVRPGPEVAAGRLYLDRGEVMSPEDDLLGERVRMATEGVAVVVGRLRGDAPGFAWGPRVVLRGVFPSRVRDAAAQAAEASLQHHLGWLRAWPTTAAGLERELVRALRRHFRKAGGRRPLVEVRVERGDGERA